MKTELIKKYIKSILLETRKTKLDFSKKYNHPGLKNDALFSHWIYYGRQFFKDEFWNKELSDEEYEQAYENGLENFEEYLVNKISLFKNFRINIFNKAIENIDSRNEISCNLVNPDVEKSIKCNVSNGREWGYIGLIIKPKVVTFGSSGNIGSDFYSINGKTRKRANATQTFMSDDQREEILFNSLQGIYDFFPKEDDDAYKKNAEGFRYNESEFFVISERIVSIVYLKELAYSHLYEIIDWLEEDLILHLRGKDNPEIFDADESEHNDESDGEAYDSWDDDGEYEEISKTYNRPLKKLKQEIVDSIINYEIDFLQKFCNANNIKYKVSKRDRIYDVPRTQDEL